MVICGIDGSGKSVQAKALVRRAEEEAVPARSISFPRYGQGFFAEVVARYLRGEFGADASSVDPHMASIPYAGDRWEAAPQIREWLADGCLVVCNRYVSANLAHQGGKMTDPAERQAFFDWVIELEYGVFQIPRPDLHVWLDMDPDVAVRLIDRKEDRSYLRQSRDIHENIEHLEATREVYRTLCQSGEGWVAVPCSDDGEPRDVDEIAAEVWENVRQVRD